MDNLGLGVNSNNMSNQVTMRCLLFFTYSLPPVVHYSLS